jgi:hypothetical protein
MGAVSSQCETCDADDRIDVVNAINVAVRRVPSRAKAQQKASLEPTFLLGANVSDLGWAGEKGASKPKQSFPVSIGLARANPVTDGCPAVASQSKPIRTLKDFDDAGPTKVMRDFKNHAAWSKTPLVRRTLSGLPEGLDDIAYRFVFLVLGSFNMRVVSAACNSDSALKCQEPGSAGGVSTPRTNLRTSRMMTRSCLCPMPFPVREDVPRERYSVAKLEFSLDEEPEELIEQLGNPATRMVYILIVDMDMTLQLQMLAGILDILRGNSDSSPEYSVLLCRRLQEGSTVQVGIFVNSDWESQLKEFEDKYGSSSRHGPISIWNENGLYDTFATIASESITQASL